LSAHTSAKKYIILKKAKRISIYLTLIIVSAVVLIPFFWMLSTSLQQPGQEITQLNSFKDMIPQECYWENYSNAMGRLPFIRWILNSLTVTTLCIIGEVLSCSLVAFAFAKLRFPGRNVLFVLMLSSMMLPREVTMIPLFNLFLKLKWIDTYLPLVVPSYLGLNAFFIFLLRQFYLTISDEMVEAARIDGCSNFGIYLRIFLPLSKPALGVVMVFSFMKHWNDFQTPLIYLFSFEKFTFPLGLRFFQSDQYVLWSELMAVSLLQLLPCLVLFFVAQKYYIQGIVVSGVKG